MSKQQYFRLGLILLLIFLLGNVICLNLFKLDDYIHTDIVAEMNYTQAVCKYRTLLPAGWIHSQELFLSRPILISALVYMVTENFIFSYQLTLLIGVGLTLLSFAYFLKSLKISANSILISLSCLMVMAGAQQSLWAYFGNYYVVFIITFFVTIGFYIRLHGEKALEKFIFKSILVIALSLYMGLSGPRLLLVLYIPIFITEVLCCCISTWKTHTIMFNKKVMLFSLMVLVSNFAGYVFARIFIYKQMAYTTSSSFRVLPLDQIVNNIKLAVIYFLNANGIRGDVELLSLEGINLCASIIAILMAALLFAYLGKCDKDLCSTKTRMVFSTSLLLVFIYCICFLPGAGSTERYFFIAPFFIVTLVAKGVDELAKSQVFFKSVVIFLGLFIIAIHYVAEYVPMYKTVGYTTEKQVAKYLVEENYDMLYGSYWHAGLLKGLARGNLNAGYFLPGANEFQPHTWLTDINLYTNINDFRKEAIVLSDSEESDIIQLQDRTTDILMTFQKVHEIGGYNIYRTNNNPCRLHDLPQEVGGKEAYDFTKGYALKNVSKVNDQEGYIEDNGSAGFIAWGPYASPKKGIYKFTLYYEVVESRSDSIGYFDLSIDRGKTQLRRGDLDKNNCSMVLDDVRFTGDEKDLEYRVFKDEGCTIKLSSIIIERKA